MANPKITLIQSEESEEGVRSKLGYGGKGRVQTVDLWVRTPDSERLEEVKLAASLCNCRRVCVAIVEESL